MKANHFRIKTIDAIFFLALVWVFTFLFPWMSTETVSGERQIGLLCVFGHGPFFIGRFLDEFDFSSGLLFLIILNPTFLMITNFLVNIKAFPFGLKFAKIIQVFLVISGLIAVSLSQFLDRSLVFLTAFYNIYLLIPIVVGVLSCGVAKTSGFERER